MLPNPSPEPAETAQVFSTRTAFLDMFPPSIHKTTTPILLVPGPTLQDTKAAAKMARDLLRLRSKSGPAIYTIRWKTHWASQGQARFAPLVRDLRDILTHLTKTTVAPHVMTLGNGALVVLRGSGSDTTWETEVTLPSLSFWQPKLEIQGRRPRLKHAPFSNKISAIGPETDVNTSAALLLKRLSHAPVTLFEIENADWFIRSQISADPEDASEKSARGYAGSWLRSWVDWLPMDAALG